MITARTLLDDAPPRVVVTDDGAILWQQEAADHDLAPTRVEALLARAGWSPGNRAWEPEFEIDDRGALVLVGYMTTVEGTK